MLGLHGDYSDDFFNSVLGSAGSDDFFNSVLGSAGSDDFFNSVLGSAGSEGRLFVPLSVK